MRGFAFEGGGARGAYHIGVVKAFIENGYDFDGFVGTSIGAINAAMLAQGDFDKVHELWLNITTEQLFDEEEHSLLQLMSLNDIKLDVELPSNIKKALFKIIGGRGVDTSKIRAFLEQYIDEDKLRNSGKDFGLVTVSLSERKPHELMLANIPKGQLVNYIMASASFPGFRPEMIEEKLFLDGGFYNNCPVNLLLDKGYDEIIAVRTRAPGLTRNISNSELVKVITAREDLGSLFLFTPENSEINIKLGYYDGLRYIKNLHGTSYYIEPVNTDEFCSKLISLDDDIILESGRMLGIPEMPPKRMLFEKIIPKLSVYLKLGENYDYADFIIALLEIEAKRKGLEKFKLYNFDELCFLTEKSPHQERNKNIFEKLSVNNLLRKKKIIIDLFTKALLYGSK